MAVLKYEKIKQDILRDIEAGKFKPGDRIYSEGDLKAKYGVSNTTVIKVMNDLVAQGYLIRRQGEGTFVRKNILNKRVFFSENTRPLTNDKKEPISEKTVVEAVDLIQQITNSDIAKILHAPSFEETKVPFLKLSQVAFINNKPWKLQFRYAHISGPTDIPIAQLKKGLSFTKVLEDLNQIPESEKMTISVSDFESIIDNLSEKDQKIMKSYFKNNRPAALFVRNRIVYDRFENAIEYDQAFIHPDYYSIDIIN